ncbi:MAG TPA: hypothetical protein VMR81_00845 [Patescibacteria group bacterium]|jgi:hypothetical protein|nr:hypothetical protein [Patescibacteria group bacterium]
MFYAERVDKHSPRYAIESFYDSAKLYLPSGLTPYKEKYDSNNQIAFNSPNGDLVTVYLEKTQGLDQRHGTYAYVVARRNKQDSGFVWMALKFHQRQHEPFFQSILNQDHYNKQLGYTVFSLNRNSHKGEVNMGIDFNRSPNRNPSLTKPAHAKLYIFDLWKYHRAKLIVTADSRDENYSELLFGPDSGGLYDENGGDLQLPDTIPQLTRFRISTDMPLIKAAFNEHIGNKGEPINPFVSFPQAYTKIERYALNSLKAE